MRMPNGTRSMYQMANWVWPPGTKFTPARYRITRSSTPDLNLEAVFFMSFYAEENVFKRFFKLSMK